MSRFFAFPLPALALPSASPTYCAPTTATAGETLVWLLAASDTPPGDGWTCAVRFTNGATTTTVTASTEDAATFRVTATAANTTTIGAGNVSWSALATLGAESYVIGRGRMQLAALSGRTANETALAAIDAAIEGRMTSAIASYEIAGRQLQYVPHAELLTLRNVYAQRVKRERTGSDFTQHLTRFSAA